MWYASLNGIAPGLTPGKSDLGFTSLQLGLGFTFTCVSLKVIIIRIRIYHCPTPSRAAGESSQPAGLPRRYSPLHPPPVTRIRLHRLSQPVSRAPAPQSPSQSAGHRLRRLPTSPLGASSAVSQPVRWAPAPQSPSQSAGRQLRRLPASPPGADYAGYQPVRRA